MPETEYLWLLIDKSGPVNKPFLQTYRIIRGDGSVIRAEAEKCGYADPFSNEPGPANETPGMMQTFSCGEVDVSFMLLPVEDKSTADAT